MAYADITIRDINYLKRWLQRKRLQSAVDLSASVIKTDDPLVICDFGAGNGEVCKLLPTTYVNPSITCYEPAPQLFTEAKHNLQNIMNCQINFVNNVTELAPNEFDIIFCLEVVEHLPVFDLKKVFRSIARALKPEGIVIIGVPIELGLPALYKGMFRMYRRYGSYDATIPNVVNAFMGRPPRRGPVKEICSGFPYYYEHLGFDHREFLNMCAVDFKILKTSSSPFNWGRGILMPELNIAMALQ